MLARITSQQGTLRETMFEKDEIRLVFPSGELEVRAALDALKRGLMPMRLSVEDEGSVELVLGEVLNNVVEHAYGTDLAGQIEMDCGLTDGALHFSVRDDGRAMPGLNLPDGKPAEVDCAREDLPEGGFGWFLVRTLVSGLDYRRDGERNILRFRIPLGADAGQVG
jgi:serine/threonine-protein kinase RsbW